MGDQQMVDGRWSRSVGAQSRGLFFDSLLVPGGSLAAMRQRCRCFSYQGPSSDPPIRPKLQSGAVLYRQYRSRYSSQVFHCTLARTRNSLSDGGPSLDLHCIRNAPTEILNTSHHRPHPALAPSPLPPSPNSSSSHPTAGRSGGDGVVRGMTSTVTGCAGVQS